MKPYIEQHKQRALDQAAARLGEGADDNSDDLALATRRLLSEFWDSAFEEGRLAALDELQDRLCVCMK